MRESFRSSITAKKFSNVQIIKGNLEQLSILFPLKYFDFSLCIWNTLGNVYDEVHILKQIAKVTSKSIFVTVYHKGTLEERKKWYAAVGVKILKIDKEREIFYSESGLQSKSYSLKDIEHVAKIAGLHIRDSKILAGVILWVELVSKYA